MNDKVLLAVLEERQSASGTRYLSGWLGKARIVGFLDREAPEGKTQWQIYAQTPQPRGEQEERAATSGGQRPNNGGRRYDRSAANSHHQIPDAARRAAGDQPF
jgi:hypothetical protein